MFTYASLLYIFTIFLQIILGYQIKLINYKYYFLVTNYHIDTTKNLTKNEYLCV